MANVWTGFFVVAVVPSPKFQAQAVGLPVEVSVNRTGKRAVPVLTDVVNDAVGPGATAFTVMVDVAGVLPPAPLLAVSVTV